MALAGAEVELAAMAQRERRLGRALGRINEAFEHVLIDCPPSLGLLTVNGLTAADQVLIPLQCEYYALEGLNQLIATINLIRDHLNPALTIKGVLLTMYDARTKLAADVAAEARRYLGDRVFRSSIPHSVRLSEAPSYGQPIAIYRPDSAGAEAYRSVTEEYLHRQGIDVTVPASTAAPGASIGAQRADPLTEQLGAA
jgi:chromosome partitioning protein